MGNQFLAFDKILEEICIITGGHDFLFVEFETGGAMVLDTYSFNPVDFEILGQV